MSLSQQIDHDIAMKCTDDVAAAISRAIQLAESKVGVFQIAFAGAVGGIASATEAYAAVAGRPMEQQDLDAMWQTFLRPYALSFIGDRSEMEALLAKVKP